MGILTIINTCVAFCVFIIIWTFLSICVLPHLWDYIGIPALPPQEVWKPIYAGMQRAGLIAFVVIITLFLLLYVIYRIIKLLPGILLAMIGWMWPPFIQLEQAGIFPLFDSILGAIFSLDPIKTRMQIIANGLEGMFRNGITFIANDLQELGFPPNAKPIPPPPLYPVSEIVPPANPTAISDKSQAGIEQKYNECLQEKIVNITNGMSAKDIQNANISNQYTRVNCKLNQFFGSIELLAQRAGS
jgi:hypothetical protein